MKGSKKIIIGFLALLLLAGAFLLASCNDDTCEHQWSPATCTLPKTCSKCSEIEGKALGHTPIADDGDCTTATTCSSCGKVLNAAAKEHTGGEATCEQKAKCSVCKKEYGELIEHTWNSDSATEENDKHCTVCGYVEEEQLEHVHKNNLTHVEAVAADCVTAGNIEYWICSCEKLFSDEEAASEITNSDDVVIAATGHSHSSEWSKDASQHWYECACGDKADVANHTYNYDFATEEHDKHCTVCGYVAEAQIVHIHTFEKELTFDDEGHYYASTCGHTDVKKDYTLHDYDSAVTDPTCTEQGFTTYTCDCGKIYQDDYTSAVGHKFENKFTYDSGGHWYDSECGHNVTSGYATHNYESVVTEPTCTKQGFTTYTCDCGYSYVGDYVSSTGHTVATWNESDSTLYDPQVCKHAVSYTGECSVCEQPQQKTEYVEKHAWTYVVKNGYEADCQNAGVKVQFCKNEDCKYHDTAKSEISYSDADAHNWVMNDVQSISDMTSYHCSVGGCNATKNTVSTSGTSANVSSGNVSSLDEIELDNAVIGFDKGIKDNLSSSGSDIEISAGTLEGSEREAAIGNANLTPEQKSLLGDKNIYDFTVTTTENVSELGGTATIRIPYNLSPGEDPDNIIVWYISDGSLTAVSATYADGYVTFTTTHFSYYVATTVSPEQLCEYLGEHDLTNIHTVSATCTEGGYTVCIRCGKQIEGSQTVPLGHEWHATVIAKNDCTTNGVTKYECSICSFNYETVVGATGHYYTLEELNNATCVQSGSATYGCIYCDSEYVITLPQLSHTYVTNVVAPTCEGRGYTEKTCLTCGDTLYTNYIEALGHKYGTVWHSNPTGHYHSCNVCGKNGEITEHTLGAEATEHSAQICTVCEYVAVPQLSHKHSLTKVAANAASCLENGNIDYYTCKCGKWFLDAKGEQLITDHSVVIVLAQGHTHRALPYVEPTCTTVGYTAGIECSVCNIVIRGHVELSAYGHDYVTTETAPTCTEEGCIKGICSFCGEETDDEIIPKIEHKYVINSIKAPTCTENGFTTFACVYCGDSYNGAEKNAYGHSYSVTWSSDENGHWHECTRCEEKCDASAHTPGAEATEESAQICLVCEFVIEPIKNHTHRAAKAVAEKEPTCDSSGNIGYYICSCGEWFYDETCESPISYRESVILSALEHDLSLVNAMLPTCTESGYSSGYYCGRCERYISGHKEIAALGHDYIDGVCERCSEKDPDYKPEAIYKTNTIEVITTANEDETVNVQINAKKMDFAGIRLRIDYSGYEFIDAICPDNAQYYDVDSGVNFVWSSGVNVTTDELQLLSIQFTLNAEIAAELTLEVLEIYRFADNGDLLIAEYEIIYNK